MYLNKYTYVEYCLRIIRILLCERRFEPIIFQSDEERKQIKNDLITNKPRRKCPIKFIIIYNYKL